MSAPLLDLSAVWDAHIVNVLSDDKPGRNPRALSGSDLHSCDYDLSERLQGAERIPRGISTFSAFERGHAYEKRVFDALEEAADRQGYGLMPYDPFHVVEHNGIPGHPDFLLTLKDGTKVVLDVTTTASKFTEWKYGHALKSAFYARALKYDVFVEWVFSIGFGGNIFGQEAHWFRLDEVPTFKASLLKDSHPNWTWNDRVEAAIIAKKKIALGAPAGVEVAPEPPIDPQDGTPEAWRCKSYCDCICPANQKLAPMKAKAS